ncbi:MAG: oligosaccharide flippase family protein [Candidatus Sedimenticola sp. (ex Thyasira tokunagai)]
MKNQRIFQAGSWVVVGHLLSQLIRLGGNLILTRILAPEMFGVMVIVNIFVMGVQMLSDLGLGQSVIQNKRGDDPVFVNTAWTLQIIRGVVIWLLICILAWLLWLVSESGLLDSDQVYAHPLLPWLLVIVGASSAIAGFNSMAIFQANRELIFGRLTLINLTAQIAGLFVIIVIAWLYETIWALAVGVLVSSFVDMLLSHKFLPGIKNQIHWDRTALTELIRFGKWIFVSSAVGFIANQGDRLILGGLLSAQVLGIYGIAFMLSNLPASIVSQLSHKVLFPNFSSINREHPDNLRSSLIKSKLWLSALVMPLTGMLMGLSQYIIDFLYDARYSEAGWMMELLLLRVATGCLLIPNVLVMMAKGLPQYSTVSALLKAIFLFFALPVSFNIYSTKEMVLMVGLSGLVSIPVLWFALLRHRLFSIRIEIFSVLLLLAGYMISILILQIME